MAALALSETDRLQPSEWLVVHTKPRQERTVCQHLGQRALEAYCPLLLEPRWHARAPRGPVPLFAGYVFVRCWTRLSLNTVRFCPGVLRPLTFAGEPATVSPDLIAHLRSAEGSAGFIHHDQVRERLEKGRPVRVMDGPLRGLDGVFQGYKRGGERARVLLEFLRCRRRVEVEAGALHAI